jgi:hypothetical protein
MLELKLAGNHLDRREIERALLRRQARQAQRVEDDATWRGEEPLWFVAPHVPSWLQEMYGPDCWSPGCYWVEPLRHRFLWIAANELPLREELIPFLMARSGQALDTFGRWVALRRPLDWVLEMLEYLPMSMPTHQELLTRFGPADDPEIEARRQQILKALLEASPQTKQQLIGEGTRDALRRVLAYRQLTPSKDEDARIEACTDLATLKRWFDRALTAVSVSDVLE